MKLKITFVLFLVTFFNTTTVFSEKNELPVSINLEQTLPENLIIDEIQDTEIQSRTFGTDLFLNKEFLMYFPEDYDQNSNDYPIMLLLHGMGKRGTDIHDVLGMTLLDNVMNGAQYPFIIMAPQCYSGKKFTRNNNPQDLMTYLDEVIARYRVDTDRVYISGTSGGGTATYHFLAQEPSRWAAAIPVCGNTGSALNDSKLLANIPMWIFHGEVDESIAVENSTNLYNAVQAEGGQKIQLTTYPGVGHDCWDYAYNENGLYSWMLSHSLNDTSITLPVEVIGEDNKVVSRTFDLAQKSAAKTIWMQVNNLSYDNKGSVRINDGAWTDLTNANCTVEAPADVLGGIGGQLARTGTIKLSVPASGFVNGTNTIDFRFNQHDGLSIGYRVIRFNVRDSGGADLITNSFTFEDPDIWVAPNIGQTAIDNGKTLWETAQLKVPGTSNNMRAKCTDCHLKTGFDLEYFAYSNVAIIERSKFHGLTKAEGEQIASYIRSLATERLGRPWNPPYQPGPQLDGKTIDHWGAGAGLDAVLDDDAEMGAYLFPNGTSQADVNAVVNLDAYLDVTELPTELQLPDWKSWLPHSHPKDIWPANYFENGIASIALETSRTTLDGADISTLSANETVSDIIYNIQNQTREWIDLGAYGERSRNSQWGVLTGTTIDAIEPGFDREYAKTNLSKWMMTKLFEVIHEYDLLEHTHEHPEVPLTDATEGTRQWPGNEKTAWDVAPHITADNITNFPWQTALEGKYMSTQWYQTQVLLNPGDHDQINSKGSPMDWSYHFNHIDDVTRKGGPKEDYRYVSSILKMWKTRNNNFITTNGDKKYEKGFRMRYCGLEWLWNDTRLKELNSYESGMRVKLFNAMIAEWVGVIRKYDLDSWPREDDHWEYLAPENHLPTGNVQFWKSTKQYYADYLWIMIPKFDAMGCDKEILKDLADWCEDAWPLGDWQRLIAPALSNDGVLDSNGIHVYPNPANDKIYLTGIEQGNKIRIISLEGFIVWQGMANSSNFSLDINSYAPGVYIIQVSDVQKSKMMKVIIKH